jgi:hypothetical protein
MVRAHSIHVRQKKKKKKKKCTKSCSCRRPSDDIKIYSLVGVNGGLFEHNDGPSDSINADSFFYSYHLL